MKNKPKPGSKALLFLMKVTFIQLLLTSVTVIFATASDSHGQELLDRKVTVSFDNAKVKDVLIALRDQAGVNFTYRPRVLKGLKNVTLNASDEKVGDVLNKIFESSVEYEVIGRQVILTAVEPEEEEEDIPMVEFQSLQISGSVTDDDGGPIPGVNIIEKGSSNGTTTDAAGKYSMNVASEASVLVFSFIGYKTTEMAVGNQTNVDIKLASDTQTLDEVIVVGYGEQRKVTVTGSVVAVQGADLQKSPAVDLSNSFAGRLAGVVAVQTSGEPGQDGSTIRIRGVNTIGNSSPLIVIDGVPDRDGGLGRIAPQDVESISVLKDASAAIYGSRAANGVILITTKKGKSGAPQVSYDFNQGWSQPTRIPKMANAYEYAQIMNEIPIYKSIPVGEWNTAWQAIQQTGTYDSPTAGIATLSAQYSPTAVQKHRDHSDPWGYPDTDWFGDAFKTWSPQGRHNLQISGGNESIKYLTSIGYVNQDAYYKNSATYYKQYNFRLNLDVKINKYINSSIGIMAREESRNFPTQSAGSIFRMLMRGRPTEPEVWPNGMPGPDIENGQNPYVITTSQTGYEKNPRDYVQSNGRIEFTNPWVTGLKLTLMGSADKTIDRYKKWETPWYLYSWDRVSYETDGVTPKLTRALRSTFSDPRLTSTTGSVLNTNTTAILNYDKQFGAHSLGVLVGTTRETFTADYVQAYQRDYISAAIDQPFFSGPNYLITGGDNNVNTYNRARLGVYGRVNYNYAEKYLAEFVWRRDGSSFFPESQRFGFFPGLLVGWNVSNEPFLKGNNVIDFLKVRASYGQMGNDQIYRPGNTTNLVEYAFLSSYVPGKYPINGAVAPTLMERTVANPNFTWEVSNNSNIGIEGTTLNGKLDFTFEYFYNRRSQMLIFKQGSTPNSTGIANKLPPVNEGKMENKGVDFTLAYNGNANGLTYSLGVNAGYNKNKVLYMDEITSGPDYQYQKGHPYGAFLAYEADGVFKTAEEVAANTIPYSGATLMPGDLRIKDINGDGKIDADDKKRLDKTTTPNFNYGVTLNFQYRNFDLSVLIQGASGALLQFGTESGDIGNYLKYQNDNRWSIDNPSGEHPRLAIRNDAWYTNGEYAVNTYYLYSKNYVRLKNIELGYNFPTAAVKKIGLSNLRLYVNGLNLVTWDKYKIFDPETASGSGQYYPQSRVLNTGLRLTF